MFNFNFEDVFQGHIERNKMSLEEFKELVTGKFLETLKEKVGFVNIYREEEVEGGYHYYFHVDGMYYLVYYDFKNEQAEYGVIG
mgnify:CR=1 FL=1